MLVKLCAEGRAGGCGDQRGMRLARGLLEQLDGNGQGIQRGLSGGKLCWESITPKGPTGPRTG